MAKKRRKNAKSELNKISDFLLATNKIVRDVNAINKGKIVDRLVRRAAGKEASKGLGAISKFFK